MKPEKLVLPLTIAGGIAALAVVLRKPAATGTTYVERQQIAMPTFGTVGLTPLSDYSSRADRPGANLGQNYNYVAPRSTDGAPLYMLPGPGNIDPHAATNPYYYLYWNYLSWADYQGQWAAQNAANASTGGCGCGCNGSGGCGGGGCSSTFPDGHGITYAAPDASLPYTAGVV